MTVIDTPPFPNLVRPVSNILDYGADPTGVGDSTTAIVNAIAAIPATGGVLFIPAGVYKVTSAINLQNRNNLTIQGEGSGPGGSGRAASSILWGGAPSSVVLDVRGVSHCVFRDFGMDPNAISGLTAMQFDGNPSFNACQFNLFDNLRFGSSTSGFSICALLGVTAGTQVSEMTFVQCRFYLFSTYGVQVNSSQSTDNLFIGCEFQGQSDVGTEIGMKVSRGGFYAYGCSFIKNNVDIDIANSDLPILISAVEAEQSNKFLNVTSAGNSITVDTGYILVSGAGAGASAITVGALGGINIKFHNLTIDNSKNIDISTSNSSVVVSELVNFVGGTYTGQKPTMTFGSSGFSVYRKLSTVGFGLAPIIGLDNRSGVTVADGSPITLYFVPAGANQLFDAAIEIDATAFTSGTATYTMTYTENGVSQTIVVTATVINVVSGVRRLIQPDASTNVTVQLTGVFTATCRLSAALMQLA